MLKLNAKKLIETNQNAAGIRQESSAKKYEQLKEEVLPSILKEVLEELEAKASKGQGLTVVKEVPKELLYLKSDELEEFIEIEQGCLLVSKAPNKQPTLKFELSESEFY